MEMNAKEVIESYVTDVAVQLPRKQRNDVAFELRALISEGLQDKAEEAGRPIDAVMAVEFLRAFGRPVDVAARYRPTLTVIDPADGHSFLRATYIGMAIIWVFGLLKCLQQPIDPDGGILRVIGQWWGTAVIPSLWWPGLLVVGFGIASWVNQRWPQTPAWKPRAGDRIIGGRAALVMGLIGIVFGIFILTDPRRVLDFFWSGQVPSMAYDAFTYTDTFLHRQAPWLLALIMLNIPLYIAVIVKGRWSATLRSVETALSLVTCAVMVWTVLDGRIFMLAGSTKTTKIFMVLIVAMVLIDFAIKLHRSVKPGPEQTARA